MANRLPLQVQLGQVMRSVRAHLGRSQQAIARRMGCTRQHLSAFENGRELPILDTWNRWLEAVGAAGVPVEGGEEWLRELLERAKQIYTEATRVSGDQSDHASMGSLGASVADLDEDTDVRRDSFLKLTAVAAGTAFGQITVFGRTSPQPLGRPPAADSAQVATVRAITAQYRRLEATTPASELIEAVRAHLQLIKQLRQQTPTGPVRGQLAAAASEAAGFAGWLAFDTNQPAAARSHYHAAVSYAQAARDRALEAYMLGSMAAWTTAYGNGNEAIHLIQKAEQALQVNASPIPRAWVTAMKATAYATMRHRDACLQAMDKAEATIASIAPDEPPMWPWLYPMSPAKVSGYRGSCAAALHLPDVAGPALHTALDGLDTAQVKQRALLLADLASVRIDEDNIDEAARLAGETFQLARRTQSEKLVDRVRGLRRQLAPWKSTKAVRTLDDQLLGAFLN